MAPTEINRTFFFSSLHEGNTYQISHKAEKMHIHAAHNAHVILKALKLTMAIKVTQLSTLMCFPAE